MMAKIHPREAIVKKASGQMKDLFIKWMDQGVTYGEMIRILSETLADIGKWIIRVERHPDDPDTPGGLE